jgi:hypothetical protein
MSTRHWYELKAITEAIWEGDSPVGAPGGGYLKWVVNGSHRDRIEWDGEEKFYYYTEWLTWLCRYLSVHGYRVNGHISWSGEETSDVGVLKVVHNIVTEIRRDLTRTVCPHCGEQLDD